MGRFPGRLSASKIGHVRGLSRNFFQSLFVDIEIGMHVLHIVVIVESFHQANHLRRLRPFQFDISIGNHSHTG